MYHFNACANSPPTRLQFELYLTPWFTALYVHPTSCHFDYHFKAFFTSPRTSLPSAAVCASSTTPLTVFSSSLHHPLPSPTPPYALPSRTPLTHSPHTTLTLLYTTITHPHTVHTAQELSPPTSPLPQGKLHVHLSIGHVQCLFFFAVFALHITLTNHTTLFSSKASHSQ